MGTLQPGFPRKVLPARAIVKGVVSTNTKMSGSGALARRLDVPVLFTTGYNKESIRFELLTRQGAQIPPISCWFGSALCQN
jgi:hypothetical protein